MPALLHKVRRSAAAIFVIVIGFYPPFVLVNNIGSFTRINIYYYKKIALVPAFLHKGDLYGNI